MASKEKVERLKKLKQDLKGYESFILTDYRGLNVEQITSLRKKLRDKDVLYHVVKNRFAKRVFHKLKIDGLDEFLIGPTGIAYFNRDITEVAKILVDSTQNTTMKIKGGYSNGDLLSKDDIDKISKLPSREVLIAQIIGGLNAPIYGFVFVLNGIIIKFLRTLKAIEETKTK